MKYIVLLFFLSLLSLDMAHRVEPRREERRRLDPRPAPHEERRTRELRPKFREDRRTREDRPGKGRMEERRTGVLETPGFGSKDRGSFRDNRRIPSGMDRMTSGRTSGRNAMERGRETFSDRQHIRGKYHSRTRQNSGRLGPTGAALAAAAVLTKRLEKPIEKAVKLGYIHPRS